MLLNLYRASMLFFASLMMLVSSGHANGYYSDSCCLDNCYEDPCCQKDCCNFDCTGAYFTYENVIVRPHFTRNNAYFLENPRNVDGQYASQFKWGYYYSPRFELGWENQCGLGVIGRWWGFNHESKVHARDTEGNITSYFAEDSSNDIGFDSSTEAKFAHELILHVGDFEATFNKCDYIFFAGGRYAHMEQTYKAVNISGSGAFKSKHMFEGVGLLIGVDYMHPLRCDWSIYVKGKGSLLYGDSYWKAYSTDAKLSTTSDRDVIPVGELQLGLDWRRCICGNILGFVRFGIEAQYWGNGGSGGPGSNAVYDEGNYQNTHPQDSGLGFIGYNISFGIVF